MFARARQSSHPRADEAAARNRRRSLPAWLDHFNANDMKSLFRAWVAIWVASLLMFIGPALHSIGLATFFGAVVLYVVPPCGITAVYVLATLSLLVGLCLGWAWGIITMKAALAARPAAQTQAQLAALEQQAAAMAQKSGQSVMVEADALVHEGFMLDSRVTVVFYVMICVYIYFVSRLRVANLKFTLVQLFGIIVLDLFLVIGPTVPSFKGLLGRILVEPGAIGAGLGAACCVLIFPQSTSHVVMIRLAELVRLGNRPLHCAKARLEGQLLDHRDLVKLNDSILNTLQMMEPVMAFLPLDCSCGRWSAYDIKETYQLTQKMLAASLSLLDFLKGRVRSDRKIGMLLNSPQEQSSRNTITTTTPTGRPQVQGTATLIDSFRKPEEGELHHRTLNALRESTLPVLVSSMEAIETIARSIDSANSGRWFVQPLPDPLGEEASRAETMLRDLRIACSERLPLAMRILGESSPTSSDRDGPTNTGTPTGPYTFRQVVIAMVVEDRVLDIAKAAQEVLSHTSMLLRTRRKRRIWLPAHLQHGLSWLLNTGVEAPIDRSGRGIAKDPEVLEHQAQEVHRYLGKSRRPGNRPRSRLSRAIVTTYHWLTNEGGMYALRMVIVTIATAIPSALSSSAGFFYREKGIWAVITAQTTLLIYMADFTFSVISRGVGTVLGGVMALVAWYIGSGSGPGNPYGLATITALMTLVLVWWRIFLPLPLVMATVMSGATFVLVLGFSYDDGHIDDYGLPGRGYEAFWKRLVTVLAGFAAAAIVQLLPRPPSATRHVRRTLSNVVGTLSDHYALFLSRWAREGSRGMLPGSFERVSLDLAQTVRALNAPIALLKLEISFSAFDQETLRQTQTLCEDMRQCLGRMLTLSTDLPYDLQVRLRHKAGVLDERNIKDVTDVLSVVQRALKAGDPLPQQLPTPLVRRCYESWFASSEETDLKGMLIHDESFRRYCVAAGAYVGFLSSIDELVLVLKAALGESQLIDRGESAV